MSRKRHPFEYRDAVDAVCQTVARFGGRLFYLFRLMFLLVRRLEKRIFLFCPNVEFFVKRIKAQADLQFVKIFGD